MTATVELHLTLAEDIARKLHDTAQMRGVSEAEVVEQALGLLFGLEDPSTLDEYWFAVATMREDWDAMPDDWIADAEESVRASLVLAARTDPAIDVARLRALFPPQTK